MMRTALILLTCSSVFCDKAEPGKLTLLRDAVGELVAELTPPPGSPPRDLKKQTWQTPGGTGPYGPGSPYQAQQAPQMMAPTQMIPGAQMQAPMLPVPPQMFQMQPMMNQAANPAPMMSLNNPATGIQTAPQQFMPPQFVQQQAAAQNQLMAFQQPQNLRQQTPPTMTFPQQNQMPMMQQGNLRATTQQPVNWIATPIQTPPGYFMGMAAPSKRSLTAAPEEKMSLQEKRDIWHWFVNATLAAGDDDAQKAAVVDELFNIKLRKAPKRILIDIEELEMANQLKKVLRSGELTTKLPAEYMEASRQYLDGLGDDERTRTMSLLQRRAGDDNNFEIFKKINDVAVDQEAPALLLFRILKANRGKVPPQSNPQAKFFVSEQLPARSMQWNKPEIVEHQAAALTGAVSGSVGPANEIFERLERRRKQE